MGRAGGRVLNEIYIIFITALVTAFFSTVFSYYKEKKFASSKYTEKSLTELYVPIYKILNGGVDPFAGYLYIDETQLSLIKEIIDDKPELVDPRLNKIVEDYHAQAYANISRVFEEQIPPQYMKYDEDYKLYTYILYAFNKTRKSLGLPYDKKYSGIFSIVFRGIDRIYVYYRNKKYWKNFRVGSTRNDN